MKFTVLVENRKGINQYSSEHGLSLYIEIDNAKFLLDVGTTDIFIKNAELLNVDLKECSITILSHGHYDHGGGLKHLDKGSKLICHPDCCLYRRSKRTDTYGGIDYTKEKLEKEFELTMTKKPYEIMENVYFLGEIPRKLNFEAKKFPMTFENGKDDVVPDDTGIVINTKNGIIVISGCAHSGICNTIEYAKEITKSEDVYAVIGGFHLKDIDNDTLKTIEYFKENNILKAYMGHCTSDEVINEFREKLLGKCEVASLYTGAVFEI